MNIPTTPSSSANDPLASNLFFIIGCPRSGTTLLQNILASHTNIYIPPETEFFMKFALPLDQSANNPDRWNLALNNWLNSPAWIDQQIPTDQFRAALSQQPPSAKNAFLTMMRFHAQNTNKPHLGEKSPHHCRHIKTILASFPNAKFIHLIRDPRDVVASRLNMPWSTGSYLAVAKEWQKIAQQHFTDQNSLPPETYTSLRYEDLVADPQKEITRLCNFLDEPFQPQMLQPENQPQNTFSDREKKWKSRANQTLSTSRIGLYKKSLNPRQIAGIEKITSPYLQNLNYQTTTESTKFYWHIQNTIELAKDTIRRWHRSITKRFKSTNN